MGRLTFETDMLKSKIYFNQYLKAMDKSDEADAPKVICNKTYEVSKGHSYRMIIIYGVIYFAVMLTYAITVNAQEVRFRTAIGWMNFLLILVTDSALVGKHKLNTSFWRNFR